MGGKSRFIALCLCLLFLLGGCAAVDGTAAVAEGTLLVHIIDVGQGDAILLQQGYRGFLIDGGPNDSEEALLAYLREQGISQLDYVVGTHPHEDHIGGLYKAITAIPVGEVLLPEIGHSTATYEALLDAVIGKGLTVTDPAASTSFLWQDVTIAVLGPVTAYDDLNNSSIVLKATHGADSFLFTGDMEAIAEAGLLAAGADVDADVLKVGHHGSDTSSSSDFLAAVSPAYAVISCGQDNTYGHPHAKTLDNLTAAGAAVYRTDISGSVVFTSVASGNLTVNATPYDSGETVETAYIGNGKSRVFHRDSCGSLPAEKNRVAFPTREAALAAGYTPCGTCKP